MDFSYQINVESYDITAVTTIRPAAETPFSSLSKGSGSINAELSFDIDRKHLPVNLEIEPLGELSICPLLIQVTEADLGSPFELVLQGPQDEPINFRIHLPNSSEEYKSLTKIEFYGPPFQVFEWGNRFFPDRVPDTAPEALIERRQSYATDTVPHSDEIYEEVQDFFQTETVEEAIMEFADELGRWLSAPIYCLLLDQCAADRPDLIDQIVRRRNTHYWARELSRSKSLFNFETWAEVTQFTGTTAALTNIPEINPQELISATVEHIETPEFAGQTLNANALWRLEQKCDITENTHQVLENRYFEVLLAKAILEGDHARVEQAIDNWDLSIPSGDIESGIDNAKTMRGEEAITTWRSLLPLAIKERGSQYHFVAANYLQSVARVRWYPPYFMEVINGAQEALFNKLGLDGHSRTARYWQAIHEGRRHERKEHNSDAVVAFERALEEALQENYQTGRNRFTDLGYALQKRFEAIARNHRDDNELTIAIKKLERGISFISQSEPLSGTEREKNIFRLEALNHEYKAEEYLQTQQLEAASVELGKVVGLMVQLGDRDSAEYFKNRRRGLQASLAEQRGEYADAINMHEAIVSAVPEENPYGQFHRARGKICQVKAHLVERELDDAADKLGEIEYTSGSTGDEIEYLKLLLSVLQDYEAGKLSEIVTVLDQLEELSPLRESSPHSIKYGHEYRPVFVSLLSAQRIRQLGIDASIPNNLVDLAIQDVLRPTHVDQVIEQQGLSDIGLKERWKGKIPIFTLKQYQQAEKGEAGKIGSGNFADIAKELTGILEAFLEFVVAYEAQVQHGEEWHDSIGVPEGDPTLGPLVNALNQSIFDDKAWVSPVRERLAEPRYTDIVRPGKQGTVVDFRNDLDHQNISQLSKDWYLTFKEDICEIFRQVATDLHILGQVKGKNAYGAYTIRCFSGGFNQEFEIMTEKELRTDIVYYFPPQATTDGVTNIEGTHIFPCTEHRALDGLEKFTDLNLTNI